MKFDEGITIAVSVNKTDVQMQQTKPTQSSDRHSLYHPLDHAKYYQHRTRSLFLLNDHLHTDRLTERERYGGGGVT